MAQLPYLSSPGNIAKALAGIKAAAVPERVNQDFVKTILKIPGGSGDQMTTFLKKIGFATADALPTDSYTKFRNPATSGWAAAQAMKHAYAPLYVRNEFAHALSDDQLLGLIVEETGLPHDSAPVKLATSSFRALKQHAKFDAPNADIESAPSTQALASALPVSAPVAAPKSFGLNLGYTININLPATSDPAVFNAIFRAIRENFMTNQDA